MKAEKQAECEVEIDGEFAGDGVYPYPIEHKRYVGLRADMRREGNRKRKQGAPELKNKHRRKRYCK